MKYSYRLEPYPFLAEDEKLVRFVDVPTLPSDTLEWIEQARPSLGRIARNFDQFPFLIELYEDNNPNIMVVAGRQTFKTTFCTDKIAHVATTIPRSEVCYVTDSEAHLSAFSRQRMRNETFLQNPRLRQFLPHGVRAAIREFGLVNSSAIYLVTDEGEYKQVEGKSLQLLMLDEAQYQDIQFLTKAMYTLFQTHGRVYILGIGGEAGSEYYKLWHRTDQREWIYRDKYWYDKLEFDPNGNITNTNLGEVLAGRWVPQKPENTQFRGYHLPQEIYPNIPRTIQHAQLHNINPEFSIEYQRRYSPHSIYESHCLGTFYKAARRPISPEMVEACYNNYLTLLKADEVRHLKHVFGNEIRVLMGVDFGSGPAASKTVISIIIHWRKSNRYQLVWIDPRPQEHQLDQARYIAELGDSYGIDYGVGDLGYGQIQVKVIQDGGRDSHDIKFIGLGRSKFSGCRTMGDETKPQQKFSVEVDEHGEQLGRLQIDKTTTIQNFIDFIGNFIAHPTRSSEEELKRTQFIIPHKLDYEIDYLMDDFCSITRKDLEEIQEVRVEDPRQRAKKEYNHPPDSVMSIIYCMVADKNFDEAAFRVLRVGR